MNRAEQVMQSAREHDGCVSVYDNIEHTITCVACGWSVGCDRTEPDDIFADHRCQS